MHNNSLLRFVFLLAVFASKASADDSINDGHPESNQPNFMLLLVDDLGWNDLGYRNPKFETPNIDQLAADSVDFQRAYVASPTCSPSRATLLTGKHPARLRMVRHIPTGDKKSDSQFDEFGRAKTEYHLLKTDPAQFPSRNWLPLEHTTYAEALGELGYVNHFVGKWHLGHEPFHPVQQGFDTQYGTTNFGHPKSYNAPFFRNSGALNGFKEGHLTTVLTDHCLELLGEHDKATPFMLSLWYYGVHRPPIGRPDLVDYFLEKGYLESDAIYAAQVKAIDESVGRIRGALEQLDLDQNTVIVFVSDQGSLYSNAPLRGTKRVDTLCEGGARVPFMIHDPGRSDARKTDDIVQTTDLFPTLVELAGGSPSDFSELDGVSLVPHIRNRAPIAREVPVIGYRAYEDLYASVRRDSWNLLAYRSGKVSLTNTVSDVSEKRDVAAEHPNVVASLKKELISWERRMNVTEYSPFHRDTTRATSAHTQKHLYGALLLRRRMEKTHPTEVQLRAFDQLSYRYTADVTAIRDAAGIDKDLIKVRDKAYKKLIQTDLDQQSDTFWLRLQHETGITDKQRDAFRETKERSNRFKAEARKLFTKSRDDGEELRARSLDQKSE